MSILERINARPSICLSVRSLCVHPSMSMITYVSSSDVVDCGDSMVNGWISQTINVGGRLHTVDSGCKFKICYMHWSNSVLVAD